MFIVRIPKYTLVMALLFLTGAAPDLSSPKAALRSLYSAVEAADAGAIRQVLLAENPPQERLAAAFSDLIVAGRKLSDAARDKFGAAGDAIGRATITEEDAAKIDQATTEPAPKGP